MKSLSMKFSRLVIKKRHAQRRLPVQEKQTITGARLDDLDGLYDAVGSGKTPWQDRLSPNALNLSLELSQMAYTMDIAPWCKAGFLDVALRVDDRLQSDVTVPACQQVYLKRKAKMRKLNQMQSALQKKGLMADVLGALRQREQSDSLKAVIMMHPLPQGHHLLVIGFMGTGRMLSDWLSNFRFTLQEGIHKGFLQLCQSFEADFDAIYFPQTAKVLGLSKLTLADVFQSMGKEESPFHLWMSGHSQGAAVMQVLTHRLMSDFGIPKRRILGVGFASPSVVARPLGILPENYPLWHLINSDDFVPRGGSGWHLGKLLRFEATQTLRNATYFYPSDGVTLALHEAFLVYDHQMVDSPSCLLHFTAMLLCIADETNEEILQTTSGKKWRFVPNLVKIFAEDKAQELFSALYRHLETAYTDLTGAPMPIDELEALRQTMRPLIDSVPLKRFLSTLACYANASHAMVRSLGTRLGPYGYITCYERNHLHAFLWRLQEGKAVRIPAPAWYQWALPSLPKKRRHPPKRRVGKFWARFHT